MTIVFAECSIGNMENVTLFDTSEIPTVQMPPEGKRKQSHPTPREQRAIKNFCDKGARLEMSHYPLYNFTYKDGETKEQIHISDLLSEYDHDKKEDARMRAAERRGKVHSHA